MYLLLDCLQDSRADKLGCDQYVDEGCRKGLPRPMLEEKCRLSLQRKRCRQSSISGRWVLNLSLPSIWLNPQHHHERQAGAVFAPDHAGSKKTRRNRTQFQQHKRTRSAIRLFLVLLRGTLGLGRTAELLGAVLSLLAYMPPPHQYCILSRHSKVIL